jgi:DNA-binding Lrp family transcriptional regulator
MKSDLTQVQQELLLLLEKNSRVDIAELALLLGIEEIQAANEIARLEADGVIGGYLTLVNWENTSLERVTALIEVRVTPQRGQGFDTIAERIFKYAEVQSVYLISGGYDLMVILEEKSLKEVARFVSDKLSTLDSVLSTATHFILKKYKDHGTVLTRKYNDEREKITP